MFSMTDLINTTVNPWNKQRLDKIVGTHQGGRPRENRRGTQGRTTQRKP